MGHIINPVSFRLGVTKFWKTTCYTFYNRYHKDICSYNRNSVEFIEWFYKSHYLQRRGSFVLKALFNSSKIEENNSLASIDNFFDFFNFFLHSSYFFDFFDFYLNICLQRLFYAFRCLREFEDEDDLLLDFESQNEDYEFENSLEYEVLEGEDEDERFDENFCSHLIFDTKTKAGDKEFRSKKRKNQIDFMQKLYLTDQFKFDLKIINDLLVNNFIENIGFDFWQKDIFCDFSNFLSKFSLVFGGLRYIEASLVEIEDDFSPYSMFKMMSTPELSHFVIFRSGFYNTKVYLYLSHPLLRSLVNSFDNDWSHVENIDYEFSRVVPRIEEDLLYLNHLFYQILNVVIALVFLFDHLTPYVAISPYIKNFFKVFKFFRGLLFELTDERKIVNLNIENLLCNTPEEDVIVFNNYSTLKRSFFFFSLRISKLQRSNEWFQKNISYMLSREYEKTWLNVLARNFNMLVKPNKLYLYVNFIESRVITTALLFNFFCKHLRQRKPVNTILGMILNELKRQKSLIGFKILTAGRFTRRERALYNWQVFKRTPLSLYGSYLDYFCGSYKSRFGVCSFKLWFFKE